MIAVAFLPIFALVDQEGRLFKPLAFTKNLAMAIAAVLAITLDPAIRLLFTRMDFTFRPGWLARAAIASWARFTLRRTIRLAAPWSGSTSRWCASCCGRGWSLLAIASSW